MPTSSRSARHRRPRCLRDTLELTITYQPNTTGPHTAVLNIGSDDANENPFVAEPDPPHSVLDFEDFTNANKNTDGDRIGASPSVVVDFPESESPWFPWGSSYGNLIDVIHPTRGPASIVLTADPGKAVQLHSFQMAGYNQDETIKSLKVINGETNAVLFNRTNVLLPGTSTANATFTFPTPLTARILIIRYDATNVPSGQSYVAIDTITFSDAMPDISVVGNLKEIVSGDTTPSLTDHSDFGRANPINGSVERTFTILNTVPSTNLLLNGLTSVSLSGPDAADFAITHQPLSPVAGKGSSTFKAVFDPTTAGLKNATVTVQSNDTDEGSYTFGISGFSGLATGTAQSLVLTAPPTAYLGQGTVALGVWSTSGLPVSLSVSGPATLSGQTLTFTGTGVVKVTATQAGAGDFNAATAVTKSISVLAMPAVLSLTNLLQVYDGTPRAIGTLGPVATVTYKVGGVDTATAPTPAGSYPIKAVAGGVIKTGTLVIAKAPLYITPNDCEPVHRPGQPHLHAPVQRLHRRRQQHQRADQAAGVHHHGQDDQPWRHLSHHSQRRYQRQLHALLPPRHVDGENLCRRLRGAAVRHHPGDHRQGRVQHRGDRCLLHRQSGPGFANGPHPDDWHSDHRAEWRCHGLLQQDRQRHHLRLRLQPDQRQPDRHPSGQCHTHGHWHGQAIARPAARAHRRLQRRAYSGH